MKLVDLLSLLSNNFFIVVETLDKKIVWGNTSSLIRSGIGLNSVIQSIDRDMYDDLDISALNVVVDSW